MSGDDSQRRDQRSDRPDRAARSGEGDGTEEGGDSSRTRPEPPADAGSGSSPRDALDDVPVSKPVLGGFGTVLVLYVILGLFLAISGIFVLNLFGGSVASGPVGSEFVDAFIGFPTVVFYGLVGPALAVPLGLWMGDTADGVLGAVPTAAVANGVGHFVMALTAAMFFAVEFDGLKVVDLSSRTSSPRFSRRPSPPWRPGRARSSPDGPARVRRVGPVPATRLCSE